MKYRLPAISGTPSSIDVYDGILMGYGAEAMEMARGAASYVDRILRGAKPSELPVQYPTIFKLTINFRTAKAIGLAVPETLLLRVDKLIE